MCSNHCRVAHAAVAEVWAQPAEHRDFQLLVVTGNFTIAKSKKEIIQTTKIFSRFDSFLLFNIFSFTPWNSNPHWKWAEQENFPAFEADVVAYLLPAVGCCRSAILKLLLPALQVVCPTPEGDGKLTDYVLPDGAQNTCMNVKIHSNTSV